MGRPNTLKIRERFGLPVNAQQSKDPDVRRTYWRLLARVRRERKDAEEQKARQTCARNFGPARCGGRLTFEPDRLGRTVTTCEKCERRKAGVCQGCPRKVDGVAGRALYCAKCRPVFHSKRVAAAQLLHREYFLARKRFRMAYHRAWTAALLFDPDTPLEVLRSIERKADAHRKANRERTAAFRRRRGIPLAHRRAA